MPNAAQILKAMLESGTKMEDNIKTVRQTIHDRIRHYTERIDALNRLTQLMDEIGDEKVSRLISFMNGDDPDKPTPTLKIGPHGPGCECPPEDDEDAPPTCGKAH